MEKIFQIDREAITRHQLEVRKESVLQRIDIYLHKRFPEYSRSLMQRLIKEGFIKVNGRATKSSYVINKDDVIDIELPKIIQPQIIPTDIPLKIIYEDEWIIAINKPADFVVHPAAGHWDDTLVNALMAHCKELAPTDDILKPGIVHRIDKDTSGVILAAKTEKAHSNVSRQFQKRTIYKEYLAIVRGEPRFDSDVIEKSIAHHKKDHLRMAVVKAELGKESSSYYEVIERFDGLAYLKVIPKTGRTHQIRVHLASIGLPCVADSTYGKNDAILASEFTGEDNGEIIISRQALHAHKLRLTHPITAKEIEFTAPLAEDMERLLEMLRKYKPAT